MAPDIVIVHAVRTPIGSFNGALSTVPAHLLAAECVKALLQKTNVSATDISEVTLGQVLQAGQGMGPGRQAAVAAGLPIEKTAYTLNQLCGSGLRAVANGFVSLLADPNQVIIAGGMESMSLAPHCIHLRAGVKMGNAEMVDTMIKDGLWDAFNGYHMGVTAENVAKKFELSRQVQDDYALSSQQKAEAAIKDGKFKDEIVPVTVKERKGDVVVEQDEFPRFGSVIDGLAKLKPAFQKDGTVTAGNASGLNDGAAAVMLMTAENAKKRGLTPLARIASWATCGVDPSIMGTGPIPASRQAAEKAGWKLGELDLIEANEAFAAQALAVVKDLALDPTKVNVNGGAIALGHPIGASGARVLVTLLHEMQKRQSKKGLATLCIGGGMGIAMCVER